MDLEIAGAQSDDDFLCGLLRRDEVGFGKSFWSVSGVRPNPGMINSAVALRLKRVTSASMRRKE